MSHSLTEVLNISSKRKSGKDYIAKVLSAGFSTAGYSSVLVHLSKPIKKRFADKYGLSLKELMSDGPYKENYRKEMVAWATDLMEERPSIFAEAALKDALLSFVDVPNVFIIVDARRVHDLSFFIGLWGRKNCFLVRVTASEQTRSQRGWVFTSGIDDATTECGLDTVSDWDYLVSNDEPSNFHPNLVRKTIDFVSNV